MANKEKRQREKLLLDTQRRVVELTREHIEARVVNYDDRIGDLRAICANLKELLRLEGWN